MAGFKLSEDPSQRMQGVIVADASLQKRTLSANNSATK
jgi:hypothetical protein